MQTKMRIFFDFNNKSIATRTVPFKINSMPTGIRGSIILDKQNRYCEDIVCEPSLSRLYFTDGYAPFDEYDLWIEIQNRFNRAVRAREFP